MSTENGKVRDGLRAFVVPFDILETALHRDEKLVYMVLRAFCSPTNPTAWPSYETIARLAGMSERHAKECVNSLIQKGYIRKEIRWKVTKSGRHTNDTNMYTILPPSEWDVQGEHRAPGGGTPCTRGGNTVHPGGEHRAPTGGNTVHPEHHQMNNTNEHIHMNIINEAKVEQTKTGQVRPDDDVKEIESYMVAKGMKVARNTVSKWLRLGNVPTLRAAIDEAVKRPDVRNPIGYITTLLENGYTPPPVATPYTASSTASRLEGQGKTNREKYAAFYAAMESSRSQGGLIE